mmetsp:Transcript_22691/g.34097  ORF Transcript_22691/g.34097 Transcript_22691/m.34097 type:complete len:102 (+) Transcript_22691:1152-1457(+)
MTSLISRMKRYSAAHKATFLFQRCSATALDAKRRSGVIIYKATDIHSFQLSRSDTLSLLLLSCQRHSSLFHVAAKRHYILLLISLALQRYLYTANSLLVTK